MIMWASIALGGIVVVVLAYFTIKHLGRTEVLKEQADTNLTASNEARKDLNEIRNLSDADSIKRASKWMR